MSFKWCNIETIDYLKRIIHFNEIKYKEKNLVFVNGVPGSGKTLTALKLLADYNSYKLKQYQKPLSAVYLARNEQLINLYKLKGRVDELGELGEGWLRSVYSYKKEHMNNPKIPVENVVLLDDAQRAWDKQRMNSSSSEADFLLKTGQKIYRTTGSVTLICFMGEGQAIHTGEEEGIKLWQDALNKRGINSWNVYCSSKYDNFFQQAERVTVDQRLNLDCSIRNSFVDLSCWIEALLEVNFENAKEYVQKIYRQGFVLRLTRDFNKAKEFILQQEDKNKDLSYGLVVSSKARDREFKYMINQGRYYGSYLKPEEIEEWFRGKNRELEQGASEFACQGLELDYPLVCFGGDYYYNGQKWVIEEGVKKYHSNKYQDFRQIVENIYRVLLSRARQGMVLYIPKLDRLDMSYQFLVSLGVREI